MTTVQKYMAFREKSNEWQRELMECICSSIKKDRDEQQSDISKQSIPNPQRQPPNQLEFYSCWSLFAIMSFFITLFCFVLQKCIVAAITTTSSLLDSVLKRKILSDLSDSVIRWLASKGVSRVGCPPCHPPPPSPRKQNKYNIMKWLSIYRVRVHIKTIPWKFRILNPKNSRVICPWSLSIP